MLEMEVLDLDGENVIGTNTWMLDFAKAFENVCDVDTNNVFCSRTKF